MPSNNKLIYLASPYSHPSTDVREHRFQQVCAAAAELMAQGHIIFSPIAHTHPIALQGSLPLGFDYWKRVDEVYLSRCDELWILTLDGWKDSTGIRGEIKIAQQLGMPIRYVNPSTLKITNKEK